MKQLLRWIYLVALVCLINIPVKSVHAQSRPVSVPGKVLVKFTRSTEPRLATMRQSLKNGILKTGISSSVDALALKHKATGFKRVFPYNPNKEQAHKKHGLDLWYEMTVDQQSDISRVVGDFKGLQEVEQAEPVLAKALVEPGGKYTVVSAPQASATASVNDPFFPLQWHYENDGSRDGVAEADINLIEAWKTQVGKRNVIVSVHDLGIDVTHPDLAPNVWVNEIEKNGKTGVDDDFNGYVDDINGYDFSGNSGKIPAGDHATHVAGTIAAVNNNNLGVCGIAGGDGVTTGVRVMSAKILNGQFDNIAASYVYAADNGAVISQNSWGYTSPDIVEQSVLDAIDYFIEEAGNYSNSPMKGGIVIFAAGNSNSNLRFYPAYYSRVLAVASLGRANQRAYYSNYGDWVEVAAPGGDQAIAYEDGILSTLPNAQYGFFQGTSMACPHVSGIAALVVSQNGGTGYKASDLWSALVTSTHDIDQYNPDYAGQLGTGYVDAAFALKRNEKKAPARVTDLSVAEQGQDFLGLHWTAVVDADDATAARYEITYANDSMDVVRKRNFKTVVVNNTWTSGDEVTTSIIDLFANTRYFVSVYSVDRWGNRSVISNVVGGMTSDGPSIAVDKSSIDFALDVTQQTAGQDVFNIQNSSNGELRWTSEVRQKEYSLDWNSVKYPQAPVAAPAKVTVGRIHSTYNVRNTKARTLDYNQGYQPRDISYVMNEYYGNYMIGEEDLRIPNSAATRFKVDYPDGFNLTNIRTLVNHNPERGDAPAVIEIYRGETPEFKNLVYAAEFNGYTNFDANYNIQLDQQLYMPSGTTFWVVIHMPAGHRYPLGISQSMEEGQSENCFISFNVGKTWTPLSDAIGTDAFVWVQIASSMSPGLNPYLTLSPVEGTVAGNNQQEVTVQADASQLINGSYYADVTLLNNDYNNKIANLPVSVSVTGQKPVLKAPAIVDFGGSFVGTSKTMEINIDNVGYGNFMVNDASTNNTDFEVVESPWKIGALGYATVKLKYTATKAGASTGALTLIDDKGNQYKTNIAAYGVSPSVIGVTPAFKSYTTTLGGSATGSFAIKNNGQYPLQFFMPKYSTGEGIDYVDNGISKYGYSSKKSSDATSGLTYSWEDISATGTEIGAYFKDVSKTFFPVDLGFEFPIFKRTTNKLMLTRYGVLTLDDQVNVNGNLFRMGDPYSPYGFISGLNAELSFNTGGKLFYEAKAGKFIVQYENVPVAWMETETVTFQLIIYDNGNVVVNYKDLSTYDDFGKQYIEVGIEDPDKQYGYLISNYEKPIGADSNFSVQIVSPGSDIMQNISIVDGTIPVGGTVNVNFDVKTDALTEGTFWQTLAIISNDPISPVKTFTVNLTVNGGGTANVSVSVDTLNLGDMFTGELNKAVFQVKNTGTKASTVQSITSDHGYFTVTHDALPLIVKPRTAAYMTVSMTGGNVGSYTDVVHVKLASGTIFNVVVSANVMAPPDAEVTFDPINDVLAFGERKDHVVSVKNTGLSPLDVVTSGNSWLHFTKAQASSIQYPDYTYYAANNKNGKTLPAYQWEEIRDTGTRMELAYDGFTSPDEKAIELPFDFMFFGKVYHTIYVSSHGLVSFTPNQDVPFFTDSSIPNQNTPNNFIAPYWSQGAFDGSYGKPFGVFYKVTADVVTIEFHNMYNIFSMGDPFHSQVLLYKNGNIKLQYNLYTGGYAPTNFGVVGVENEDGTSGVRVAAYESFIENKLAVLLTPATKTVLEPGASQAFTLTVDATALIASDYSDHATIETNVPGKTSIEIPANLTVTGDAELETASNLDLGDCIVDPNSPDPTVFVKEFSVANRGAANLVMTSMAPAVTTDIAVAKFYNDPWFGPYWTPISFLSPEELTVAPGESMLFRLELIPSSTSYSISDTLLIANNSPVATAKVPIRASVMLPASMEIDQQAFSFSANDATFNEATSFTIDNSNGQSPLKYSMDVVYSRSGQASQTSIAPKAQKALTTLPEAVAVNAKATAVVKSVDGYNRALEYTDRNDADNGVGFGIGMAYIAGIKFQADNQGFNLSHIQTYYSSGMLTQSTIQLEVYLGDDINAMTLLTSDEFQFNDLGPDYKGNIILPLTQPQTILPNESFFVVIRYPFGTGHPQGVINTDNALPGHFFFNVEESWYDLSTQGSFAKSVYQLKALEKSYVDGAWLSLDAETTGSVAAGETKTIDFSVFSKNMKTADVFATIVVHGNVPSNPTENVDVTLHMNQAPEFDASPYEFEVDENDTLRVTLPVKDQESDAVTITSSTLPTGLKYATTDSTISITYVPDFESAGSTSITFNAKDAGNRTSSKVVDFHVFNVNRMPVVVNSDDRHYDAGMPADEVEVSSIISDPDTDDLLTVSATSSDPGVVEVFASTDRLRIKTHAVGEATLTVTVADNHGGTISTTIKVIVNLVTGIETPAFGKIRVYPNPAPENIIVELASTDKVNSINVIDAQGQIIKTTRVASKQTRAVIDVRALQPGLYLLRLHGESGYYTHKFIKE